ncbi:MAG: o-succinylbenzoate synthase [Candidatus Omnitrophica bacterium]|nr:o-succinylbenzoate synthase [Candidatus Omnitrophota bacterium]
MIIKSAKVYQYSLKLRRPLVLHDQTMQNREGLVLQLISEEGLEGFGEIAPLPFFSEETFDDARDQLFSIKEGLCSRDIPERVKNLNGKLGQWVNNPHLKPSVRFGIESAVLGLMANAAKTSIGKLIAPLAHPSIKTSGLLSGSDEDIVVETRELLDHGFKEMKLKATADYNDTIKKVNIVLRAAYGKAIVHLDVNRAWDFETAVSFGRQIGCDAISYIEEPFDDILCIPEFYSQAMIPVALDESLKHLTVGDLRAISGVEVLILKPTILGGIEKTRLMMQQSEQCALIASVSSSFESSLGLSVLADVASTSSRNHVFAGLDTLKWFKQDLLHNPVRVENGSIMVRDRAISSNDINFNLLRQL